MNTLYAFARTLCGIWLKIVGVRIIGKENIPQQQPVIVIANHLSFGDPPILVSAFPYHLTFLAKEEFAHQTIPRLLFSALGAVFLKRDDSDLSAMRTVLNILKEGHSAAIFPEGRRTFGQGMTDFKQGAAYLACRSKVTVVPVALTNTGDLGKFWRRNIVVKIGQPIDPNQFELPLKEQIPALTKLLEQTVTNLHQQCVAVLQKEGKIAQKKN